ncbi:MAG: galactokinase [Erythrobacter sp.]
MDRRERLIARAKQGYRLAFGAEPSRFFAAPGRVNLIGEHVDYNGGYVLPAAINRDTVIALGPADKNAKDAAIEAVAIDMASAKCRIACAAPITPGENAWENHVRGVIAALRALGHQLRPARLAIAGDIPIGAGLSSSASLGVAIALALSDYSNLSLSREVIAKVAQSAENDFVGCACGIMDQMASACASEGHALLLDCESLQHMPIPIDPRLAIMVIDTGIRRQLTQSAFNQRRAECAAAARHFGVASLRDLAPEVLEAGRATLDPVLFARARHVVQEIALVEPAAVALATGNTALLAEVMAASHWSLAEDYAVSLPAIDALVTLLAEVLGDAGGVRLTGAGFGGCLVAVVDQAATAAVIAAVEQRYNPTATLAARAEVFQASAGASAVRRL